MPRSLTKLPKPKSPAGIQIGEDGSQQSVVADPMTDYRAPKMSASDKEIVTISFPNYETVDWSSRPTTVVNGWYRDVRKAALATGGTIQYDEPSVEFITVKFSSVTMARRFYRRLVEESEMDPKKIDATVKRPAGVSVQADRIYNAVATGTKTSSLKVKRAILDKTASPDVSAIMQKLRSALPLLRSQKFEEAAQIITDAQNEIKALHDSGTLSTPDFHGWQEQPEMQMEQYLPPEMRTALMAAMRRLSFKTRTAVRTAAQSVPKVDLSRYLVTTDGHVVFAAADDMPFPEADHKPTPKPPVLDESMETEADPHDDVQHDQRDQHEPKPGDEVLVISLDDAMVGTLGPEDHEDGSVVVELEDGPIEAEKSAVRVIQNVSVRFASMPERLRLRGLPVQFGKVASVLHRAISNDVVEIMTPEGPRRVQAESLICPIKMADLGAAVAPVDQDFMDTLRAAGAGRVEANRSGSGLAIRFK